MRKHTDENGAGRKKSKIEKRTPDDGRLGLLRSLSTSYEEKDLKLVRALDGLAKLIERINNYTHNADSMSKITAYPSDYCTQHL